MSVIGSVVYYVLLAVLFVFWACWLLENDHVLFRLNHVFLSACLSRPGPRSLRDGLEQFGPSWPHPPTGSTAAKCTQDGLMYPWVCLSKNWVCHNDDSLCMSLDDCLSPLNTNIENFPYTYTYHITCLFFSYFLHSQI